MNETPNRGIHYHILTTLSTIGIFKDETAPSLPPPDLSSYLDIQSWESGSMRLHGAREQAGVFFSQGDLTSARHLTTYTATMRGRTFITGMKVCQDESSTTLGESTDDAKSFSLDGDIESISVYYEPEGKSEYRINGLRFKIGQNPDSYIGVGLLKGVHEEVKFRGVSSIAHLCSFSPSCLCRMLTVRRIRRLSTGRSTPNLHTSAPPLSKKTSCTPLAWANSARRACFRTKFQTLSPDFLSFPVPLFFRRTHQPRSGRKGIVQARGGDSDVLWFEWRWLGFIFSFSNSIRHDTRYVPPFFITPFRPLLLSIILPFVFCML